MANSSSAGTNTNVLTVEFRDSQKLLYSGPATAVSSLNSKGRFDILPQHTHFISLINDEVLIYNKNPEPKKFTFDAGVLRCINNTVTIFIGLDSKSNSKLPTE